MSAASVERPHGDRPLIAEANRIMDRLPGYRVEIIGGKHIVSQGMGLWLPTGTEDYAIPDLSCGR